jgi:lysophospholipase L1-like esterase
MRAARMAEERAALAEATRQGGTAGKRRGGFSLSARVSPEQYEENLRSMVRLVRQANARPILLDVPMNLVWPPKVKPAARNMLKEDQFWGSTKTEPPYLLRVRAGEPACERSVAGHPYLCMIDPSDLAAAKLPDAAELARHARDPSSSERERLRAAHNGAVRELVEGDPRTAARQLTKVAAAARRCRCLGPQLQLSWLYYNLGIARLMAGHNDAAFDALLNARRIRPFAMSPEYAERFRRVVEELDVEWVNLPQLFAREDPRLRGSALMSDWVHPNQRGNAVIARAIARELLDGESSSPDQQR